LKWTHELTSAAELEMVVDRGLAIGASEPAGRVTLTFPAGFLERRIDGCHGSVERRITRRYSHDNGRPCVCRDRFITSYHVYRKPPQGTPAATAGGECGSGEARRAALAARRLTSDLCCDTLRQHLNMND